MELRKDLGSRADAYYAGIAINDFSSFIQSDFQNDVLIDLSEDRYEENRRQSEQFLADLKRMQESGAPFTADENAMAEALKDFAEYIRSNSVYYWHKFNVTHNTCPIAYVIKRLETYPLPPEEQDRYLVLLGQLPGAIRGLAQKLLGQRARGIRLHPEEAQISVGMFASFLQDEASLLNPKNRGIGISPAEESRVEEILAELNREIAALQDVIGSCTAGAGQDCSLSAAEDGKAYYDSLIYTYTSTHMSPEEIHETGLQELSHTRKRMQEIIRELGSSESIEEFNSRLWQNPAYRDNSPEELEARFRRHLDAVRPKLPEYFLHLPKADCDVRALPAKGEAATSWGYYSRPIGTETKGIFYCSAAELSRRSQIRSAAIIAHELLPGHHFQTSLADEDKTLPLIQQKHFNTAFSDGWAEYASDLAGEMGLYNLWDLYGRYIWDAILCVRLVVDTGMNALGWSLEKARGFMKQYTLMTDQEIRMESLRYMVDMPGQALAYKIGSLKMHELRERAEREAGSRFDIRAYHDMVLKYGSIPLYLAEKNVNRYIQSRT